MPSSVSLKWMSSYWRVCTLDWRHVKKSSASLEIVQELLAYPSWVGSGEWAGSCYPEVDTFYPMFASPLFSECPESNIQAQVCHSVKLCLDLSVQTYFYSLCDTDEPSGWCVLPHLSEHVVIQSIKAPGDSLLFTFYSKLPSEGGRWWIISILSKCPVFWSCGETSVQECANVFWCEPWLWFTHISNG